MIDALLRKHMGVKISREEGPWCGMHKVLFLRQTVRYLPGKDRFELEPNMKNVKDVLRALQFDESWKGMGSPGSKSTGQALKHGSETLPAGQSMSGWLAPT